MEKTKIKETGRRYKKIKTIKTEKKHRIVSNVTRAR
jgi:hypothetical protein